MMSRKATMNRLISSAVPTDTRRCSSSGGNGRPTITRRFLNSSTTGLAGRLRWTMKKFASDGIDS
jgi:hypothetical protein